MGGFCDGTISRVNKIRSFESGDDATSSGRCAPDKLVPAGQLAQAHMAHKARKRAKDGKRKEAIRGGAALHYYFQVQHLR